MSHRTRYAVATNRATVIDLLALDPLNPRAIMYQLNEVSTHIGFLPESGAAGQLSPLQRAMLQTHTNFAIHTTETLDTPALRSCGDEFAALSTQLSAAYLA